MNIKNDYAHVAADPDLLISEIKYQQTRLKSGLSVFPLAYITPSGIYNHFSATLPPDEEYQATEEEMAPPLFSIGDLVSIDRGSALTPTAVMCELAHCEVIGITEKAIQLSGWMDKDHKLKAWIPLKALQLIHTEKKPEWPEGMTPPKIYKLAPWFKGNKWVWIMLKKYSSVSATSV